jgi:hypothetical protein
MIVREIGERLWLFDQRDHSTLCGDLSRAWGAGPFPGVPAAVQRAAEHHDGGWPEWDARPRLDPTTGHPHPYSRMPDADYHRIWTRGLARGWALGEEAGLLVSLHAMRFFGHKQRPEDRALYASERRRQQEALRRLGATHDGLDPLPEPFATWHAWMSFWDGLSLFLCEGWTSPWTASVPAPDGEVELRTERRPGAGPGATVTLAPFPFHHPLHLRMPARLLPARRFSSQEELDEAVASAPVEPADWHVEPPPP